MYQADHHKICANQDTCRKYSSSHPTLAPEFFYGFQVMESHKSPRHHFEFFLQVSNGILDDILRQWVQASPLYILKSWTCSLQEHYLFSGEVLLVRIRGGYSLDNYASFDVASKNSQVNKQANAGLQRIKWSIAYMKPDNFMFHVKLLLAWIAK